MFVFNVYEGIKGRWACPICNVCVIFFYSHIYLSVIHFTYCYFFLHICFFPLDLENNDNVEDVAVDLELIGWYLLLTEVKFTTSGTIRYNVIKTFYYNNIRPCYEMECFILIKRWENHINIYATFVDECMAVPYGMYDLILHLAVCVFLFWIEPFLFSTRTWRYE